jgi:hypothetical protein
LSQYQHHGNNLPATNTMQVISFSVATIGYTSDFVKPVHIKKAAEDNPPDTTPAPPPNSPSNYGLHLNKLAEDNPPDTTPVPPPNSPSNHLAEPKPDTPEPDHKGQPGAGSACAFAWGLKHHNRYTDSYFNFASPMAISAC